MRTYSFFILIGMMIMISTTAALAVQDNRELAVDSRIRTYVYDPNEVYVFRGHYRYQSSIELSPNEVIETVSMGDSVAWQIQPSGNRLFLKPIEQDATTNMTIVTNKRLYHFELYAEEAEDIRAEEMVFSVRFAYPNAPGVHGSLKRFHGKIRLPDVEGEPDKYNLQYTISGSRLISPVKIFDDGEFTYVEFRDKNADIPAFFLVNSDGSEELINYHVEGPYLIIERVTSQFTLRHGNDVACIFNEARPLIR